MLRNCQTINLVSINFNLKVKMIVDFHVNLTPKLMAYIFPLIFNKINIRSTLTRNAARCLMRESNKNWLQPDKINSTKVKANCTTKCVKYKSWTSQTNKRV